MWKHKNFINLQLCAGPQPFPIAVNGTTFSIQRLSDSMVTGEETWSYNASINTDNYTISGNTVVWNDGTILQYNGVDVVPTDNIVFNGQYTTRSATPTLTFKHFYDAGTIGSGTVKFRHYSQQEPLPQLATPQNVTANGTTVSWDEVTNATSYSILADGTSIGTVENQNGYTVTLTCQNGSVGFNYSVDNMSADLFIDCRETKNIIVTEYLFIRAIGMTPEVVSYSGGILETGWGFGKWKFTPTQNNATITVIDND